jgi:hypothetical protein
MSTVSSVERYTDQRAILLANLVLTRRPDVRILPFQEGEDSGIDLIAQVVSEGNPDGLIPSFAVEVKGTSRTLPDEASAVKYGNQHAKQRAARRGFIFLPTLVFLFSMDGDLGYYSWIMEPAVNAKGGPSLTRVSPLCFQRIGKETLDTIIARVQDWIQAMAKALLKNSPGE